MVSVVNELSTWYKNQIALLTGGGNIVFDEIYGMAGCDIGFPLNDDIPLNVHSNQELKNGRLEHDFLLLFFKLMFAIDYCCLIFNQKE